MVRFQGGSWQIGLIGLSCCLSGSANLASLPSSLRHANSFVGDSPTLPIDPEQRTVLV